MKFRAIIVDDLPEASKVLRGFCERSEAVDVVGSFPDGLSALEYLQDNAVDLVFLDVEMPGITGFEFIEKLAIAPRVILTTSKTEYAYEAFQHHVADFLRKPFTYARFLESLQRLAMSSQDTAVLPEPHLFIKVDGSLVRLRYEDILFVESAGDYVRFVTSDRKYLTHSTIKSVESRLPASAFIKVHRSYIVNLSHLLDFQEGVVHVGSFSIPVSKANKSRLKELISSK